MVKGEGRGWREAKVISEWAGVRVLVALAEMLLSLPGTYHSEISYRK